MEEDPRGDVEAQPGPRRQHLGRRDRRRETGDLEVEPQVDPAGLGEDEIGSRAMREAGEGLEPDGRPGLEVHDRLEDRPEGRRVDHPRDLGPRDRRLPALAERGLEQRAAGRRELLEGREVQLQALHAVRTGRADPEERDRCPVADRCGSGGRKARRNGVLVEPPVARLARPGFSPRIAGGLGPQDVGALGRQDVADMGGGE